MPITRRSTNAKTASRIGKTNPSNINWVLISFGRPFYLISLALFIAFFYGISIIGYTTRIFVSNLLTLPRKIHHIKIQIPLPKPKIRAGSIIKLLQKTPHFRVPKNTINIPSRISLYIFYTRKRLSFLLSKLKSTKKPTRQKETAAKRSVNLVLPVFYIDRTSVRILTFVFIIFSLTAFAFWAIVLKDLPSPDTLTTRKIDVSTKIYDRNGILLYTIYKDKNRSIVNLDQIPTEVRLATLAAEDAEFYDHPGFSVRGIARSIFKNLENGEVTGGSTITQQLVKNALLTPEKTLERKLKEIALAIRVEISFSKDQILEMYLNEVSYGGTAYGVAEASEAYFGKSVSQLNLAEAAFLAGLPKSPSKFSPFSGSVNSGIDRQKDVLNLMKINKFITEDQERDALATKLVFAPSKTDIKAPHFVMYVRQQLAEKYGEDVVETGGLEVVTTLDYKVQKFAEDVLAQEVAKLKPLHVGNGAVVILDPKTGAILAMVGSKNYFDPASDGNVNVAIQNRPPGSSIKVVNYAYALGHGFTPASIIDDSPTSFSVPGQAPYTPKNYDGKFRGNITLRSALAESRNIPAVKVLASYGVTNMIDLGTKMGITTWGDKSQYGLSLTLGGGGVRLLDLAQVYATVANYGKTNETWAVGKITNYKGKVLEDNTCSPNSTKPPCSGQQVLDNRVAYLVTDILKDNTARSPAFGSHSQLVIPGHPEVAVKTGTSNDLRDNLTVGYNQDYVVAVWVGNNDNSPMSRVASGLTGASSIFHGIMSGLLADQKSLAWDMPTGIVKSTVCSLTGSLPCEGCPTRPELFLSESLPTRACRPDQIIVSEEGRRGSLDGYYPVDF